MASEVDICNIALAHLGDSATVATIDPPDGSIQADHCARFYPHARDTLLDMHSWDFATTRIVLAPLSSNGSGWSYTYAAPNDMLSPLAVLDSNAADDYSAGVPGDSTSFLEYPQATTGVYTPQPFVCETDEATGASVIRTNQSPALLRFTRRVTDPTQFTPLFTRVLTWLLASDLAGPILKGDAGQQACTRCLGMAMKLLGTAASSDSSNRQVKPRQSVPWMVRR